jgi:hypothetical protein
LEAFSKKLLGTFVIWLLFPLYQNSKQKHLPLFPKMRCTEIHNDASPSNFSGDIYSAGRFQWWVNVHQFYYDSSSCWEKAFGVTTAFRFLPGFA